MIEIKVPEIIHITKYKTIDGMLFDDFKKASLHEDMLNGLIKTCTECNGTGHINKRHYTSYQVGYDVEKVYISDPCLKCNGKGHLRKTTKWE